DVAPNACGTAADSMSPFPRVSPQLVLVAMLLALLPLVASAQSRQQRAVAALEARMAAAEQRYLEAQVRVANADPAGAAEADAALEDIEDVVVACQAQRGCHPSTMLAVYKRLLKVEIDTAGAGMAEAGLDPHDPEPDHSALAADVPEAARAAHLLQDGHGFDDMVQFN